MTIIPLMAVQFALLSMLAFGGINVILPELHRFVVDTNHWISSAAFADMFAISQATPGPNVIFITLLGWHLAGIYGAIVATLAFCGPSGVLVFAFMHVWNKVRGSRWHTIIQKGVAPLAVGLVLASGCIITHAADETLWAYLLTGVTLLITLRFKLNPLWLIIAGGLLGLSGKI